MDRLTLQQFQQSLLDQGVPPEHYAVKCPVCGTIQSGYDLIRAGAGNTFEEVATSHLGFDCIGRFTNAGPHTRGSEPGKGCDWTLGGFLHAHKLLIVMPDGTEHPHFEVATKEEADAHMAESLAKAGEVH